MKGYYVSCGYMGYIHGRYMLFDTEEEYKEAWYDCNVQ